MVKQNKKYGFTLAECLIAMSIIGILLAIVLPSVILKTQEKKDAAMYDKAYATMTKVVAELVNDEDLYPENKEDDDSNGLANTVAINVKGKNYSGDTKFCELFASRLKILKKGNDGDANSEYGCKKALTIAEGGNFTTIDGIVWSLPIGDMKDGGIIAFDIKTVSETKSCWEYADTNDCSGGKKANKFPFKVTKNGTITRAQKSETK